MSNPSPNAGPSTPENAAKKDAAKAPKHTDVLIVGAGPAGASVSLFLSQAQVPHTLIDKATFPRDKIDGNVHGAKVVEVLNRLDPDYFAELMARADQTLGGDAAHIFTPNGNRFKVRFPHSDDATATGSVTKEEVPFFTINRRHFDDFLVKKLDATYARPIFGASLKSLERKESDLWHATYEANGQVTELRPKVVVAADGVNSTVLRLLDKQLPPSRFYDTVQGYFRGVTGFEEDSASSERAFNQHAHIEGHFLPESTPGFFFISPLANGIFNVGVGKPRTEVQAENIDLKALLHQIIEKYPQISERFTHAEPISEIRAWPLALGSAKRVPISGEGYLAVGDAAGLCSPLTYFGTGSSMVSGMLAAEQIQRSVSQQKFDAKTLADYDRAVYDRLQKEFQTTHLIKSFVKQNWVFDLVSSNTLVKSVLRRSMKQTSTLLKRL